MAEETGCFDEILDRTGIDTRELNDVLETYGQHLWKHGAPYYHFSETVNAVASLRRELRRGLGRAWDLGFSWLDAEPTLHHAAMPAVLFAATSAAAWSGDGLSSDRSFSWDGTAS